MDTAELSNDELTFEEKLTRLESIVTALEEDMPSLEEALSSYENGMELADACLSQLKDAELRIEEISLKND